MKTMVIAASLIAVSGVAQAASLNIERFSGPGFAPDFTFTDRCGGSDDFDCEFFVAEGRIGDKGLSSAENEVQLLNRLDNTVEGKHANGASGGFDLGAPNPFSLVFDASTEQVDFSYLGETVSLTGMSLAGVGLGPNNPDSEAKTLYFRVREANLTELGIDGHAIDTGELLGIDGDIAYLVMGGYDLTNGFTVTGLAELNDTITNASGSAFQIKVTDLQPIPLPAAGWLLIGGVASLVGVKRARRAA